MIRWSLTLTLTSTLFATNLAHALSVDLNNMTFVTPDDPINVISVTISTDDPAMFDCTLAGEYEALEEHFGYHPTVLVDLAENAIRAAWIGSRHRERLLAELREWRSGIS